MKPASVEAHPRSDELDGAVVNVELLRYPQAAQRRRPVIEILGRPGDLGVDTEIIIRKLIEIAPVSPSMVTSGKGGNPRGRALRFVTVSRHVPLPPKLSREGMLEGDACG